MEQKNAHVKGIDCYEKTMVCNGSQNRNSVWRKKRNQVQAKDTRSKVMIVRDAGIGNI